MYPAAPKAREGDVFTFLLGRWQPRSDITARVTTPAATENNAGLRVPHGSAPTAPTDGDLWTTTAGLFARINGATVGPFGAGGGGSPGGSDKQVQFNNAGAFGGIPELVVGTAFTGTSSTAVLTANGSYAPASASSNSFSGMRAQATLTASANTTGARVNGATATAIILFNSTTARTVAKAVGIDASISLTKTGSASEVLTSAIGSLSRASVGTIAGIITIADYRSFSSADLFSGASSVTDYYGLHLATPSGGIMNRYGVYQQDGAARNIFAGIVETSVSTTSRASVRIPHGAAPTAPVDGDMWTTTDGLYVQINGATVGPLLA